MTAVPSALDSADAKLLATEFDRLPAGVQRLFLAPPLLSATVQPADAGFALADPAALDRPAPQALLPRLAIKTWRDSGVLGVIYAGLNLRVAAERLLAHPTAPQRRVAAAWLRREQPLRLTLWPYVDFSGVSEVRFLVLPGRRAQRINACLRGETGRAVGSQLPRLRQAAEAIAAQLPAQPHIVDLGCFADGRIALVDLNPGLTPRELAALRSAEPKA
ncbi:MAG: hypothetical protein ACK5TK_09895 [Betaproteobacteria bacterium]